VFHILGLLDLIVNGRFGSAILLFAPDWRRIAQIEEALMKRALLGISALLVFSGCYETNFNFKTILHSNGQMERETYIDGRGANRFQAPSGSAWKVESSQSRGGQTILEDTHYHIHATGRI
jgi:hypothetical protein